MAHVVYEVFIDRFAAADGGLSGDGGADGHAQHGGTLDGLTNHFNHIKTLGADALYLTPITPAPSAHRYDATCLTTIDEALGGAAAFARLMHVVSDARVELYVDLVLNHVGHRHPWSRAEDKANWFRGTNWRGHHTLPELDLSRPAVRDALFGARGVIATWAERGVAGFRLDCANDLGPQICALATKAALAAGARAGTIGEVMAYPRGFLDAGVLDGVMNYWLRATALPLFTGKLSAAAAQRALDTMAAEFSLSSLLCSWTILTTHDTPRLQTELGTDHAKAAFVLQFLFPGTPLIYYGEELGMEGGADPDNRRPMDWSAVDGNARYAWVHQLVQLRRHEPALIAGRYESLASPGVDCVAFARTTDDPADTLICVVNPTSHEITFSLMLPLHGMFDALSLVDVLNPRRPAHTINCGRVELSLMPSEALVLKPHDADASGYRFFAGLHK